MPDHPFPPEVEQACAEALIPLVRPDDWTMSEEEPESIDQVVRIVLASLAEFFVNQPIHARECPYWRMGKRHGPCICNPPTRLVQKSKAGKVDG